MDQWPNSTLSHDLMIGKLKQIRVILGTRVDSHHKQSLEALPYSECKCYWMVVIDGGYLTFLGHHYKYNRCPLESGEFSNHKNEKLKISMNPVDPDRSLALGRVCHLCQMLCMEASS